MLIMVIFWIYVVIIIIRYKMIWVKVIAKVFLMVLNLILAIAAHPDFFLYIATHP